MTAPRQTLDDPPVRVVDAPAATGAPPPSSADQTVTDARVPQSDTGAVARAIAELRHFPRQFWLLSFGFFVLLAGIDMCYPFQSTYLHERLGYSMTTVGLLMGVPLLCALPFYVLDGAITDRFGRKAAIALGGCFMVGLYSTFAFAGVLWQLALAISLEAAFGWALFLTGSNAMVADLVPLKRRAEAYGITRVALHIGMIVGPLIGAVLIARDPTYRTLFLATVVTLASFIVLVLASFRETRPEEAKADASIGDTLRGYGNVLRDRRFLLFCVIALLPLFCFGHIWPVLPVLLLNAHGIDPHTWGYLVAFYALCVAVCQYPVIRLLRGRDHILMMAAASLFVGLGLGGAVLLPWGPLTFVALFVLGQGALLLIPISSTVSAQMAPVALRGRYMGAWTMVQQAGVALGPTFGGLAMDRLGARTEAALVVCFGVAGAALYAALAPRLRPQPSGARATSGPVAAGAEADAHIQVDVTQPEDDEAIGDTLAGETPIA